LGTEEKKIVLKGSAYLIHKLGFYPDIFIRVQVLFYIIQSIRLYYTVQREIKEGRSSVSENSFSWIRFLIAGYAASFVISVPALLINLYVLDSPAPAIKLIMMLPFLIYFNIIFFRAWLHPGIFAGVAVNVKYKTSRLTKEEAELWIDKLNRYIALNKPYLAADLTLNQLAEALDISPRTLSQIINEYFNQNFIDYINRLRIEESKLLLLDSMDRKTVLEILYAVGFNNKSAYNIAFKRATGLTPTEFRKKYTN
jgi:AraC-like DNA-binding protein